MTMKLMTIVGTRPEIIKLSRIVAPFEKYFNHVIVHTGQNYDYELNEVFFKDLGVRKPDYFLDSVKGSAAQTKAQTIAKFDDVIQTVKPDAILVYGDKKSCLAVISARRLRRPIFHMEAGSWCFDQRVQRDENVDNEDNFKNLLDTLNYIATKFSKRNIVSTHSRIKKRLVTLNRKDLSPLIEFMKPMGYFDYNKLQKGALCVISERRANKEESTNLKFPAIKISQAHERPECMQVGASIVSGLNFERVYDSINRVILRK